MAEFSSEQKTRFDEGVKDLLSRFPDDQKGAALLEVLHLVQEITGWVSYELMPRVAEVCAVPLVQVREVATFYTMYHLEPPGRYHLEVCTNVSCQLLGGEEILERVCNEYGIKPGEKSADGRVSVEVVECLGSCGTAPMIALNREYRENLTRTRLDEIFEEIGA